MFVFKHPKYYKELRDAGNELAKRNAVKEDLACSGSSPARNKSDQVISSGSKGSALPQRAPGPGHKHQAASSKPQASSFKPQAQKASSHKLQAPSNKPQA
jgi:hypothetical protein